jgi:hypothetical protein
MADVRLATPVRRRLNAGTFRGRNTFAADQKGSEVMLWTIAVILLVLWLLGFTLKIGAGLIHILLVIAIIVGLIQLFSGRRGGRL